MRALSWLLFSVGTGLAAAFGAKLRPGEPFDLAAFFGPSWWPFWAGIALTVVGGLLLRGQLKEAAARGSGGEALDLPALRALLDALCAEVEALAERVEAGAVPPEELKAGLERALGEPMLRLIEGREALAAVAGVAARAEVMTRVAAAERKLNRAWSALVDEAPEEAAPQVVEARAALREARAAFPSGA